MYYNIFFIYFLYTLKVNSLLTNDERNSILSLHNNIRSEGTIITATNMIKLKWDIFLELEAEKLSNTCIFEHSTNNYGQNLYYTSNRDSTFLFKNGINTWYNEIEDHKAAILNSFSNKIGIGRYDHVSQLLWAKTERVGCSFQNCNIGLYLVCNYFPPGNVNNQEWFISGKECLLCPTKFPNCNNKLCNDKKITPPPNSC